MNIRNTLQGKKQGNEFPPTWRMRQAALKTLVKDGLIGMEEAKTLPNFQEMRDAFYRAAEEVAAQMPTQAAQMKQEINKATKGKLPKTAEDVLSQSLDVATPAYALARSILGASALFGVAKSLEKPGQEAQSIYTEVLIQIISYCHHQKTYTTLPTELGPYEYGELVYKHLPKRTMASFKQHKPADKTPK